MKLIFLKYLNLNSKYIYNVEYIYIKYIKLYGFKFITNLNFKVVFKYL